MRKWLKQKRLKKGYTLRQLAEIVGVSEQSLSYYENGDRLPTPKIAMALGKALDFDWTIFYKEGEAANGDGECCGEGAETAGEGVQPERARSAGRPA